MTFEINNLGALIESANNLTRYNQEISSYINSLNYVINAVQNNWQNEAGADIQSILVELRNCIAKLENNIQPTMNKFVQTINTIAAETEATQGQSIMG